MMVFNGHVTVQVHMGTLVPRWIYETFQGRRGGGRQGHQVTATVFIDGQWTHRLTVFELSPQSPTLSTAVTESPAPSCAAAFIDCEAKTRTPCAQPRTPGLFSGHTGSPAVSEVLPDSTSHCPAGHSGRPVTCR